MNIRTLRVRDKMHIRHTRCAQAHTRNLVALPALCVYMFSIKAKVVGVLYIHIVISPDYY